jgi:hypothetical protein
MFVHTFFAMKQLLLALVFSAGLVAASLALLVRLIIKDLVAALIYLPAALFNAYSFVVNVCIVMLN